LGIPRQSPRPNVVYSKRDPVMSNLHPIFEKTLQPYMIDPETSNLPLADKPHEYWDYSPKGYNGEICGDCGKDYLDSFAKHICPNCGECPKTYDCVKARC
jgi:hypothetical protein